MWSTFWITLERRIHLIFMVANFLLMAYTGRHLLTSAGDFAVQFEQSKAYNAPAGESVVLAEISDWIRKDMESLFREFGQTF